MSRRIVADVESVKSKPCVALCARNNDDDTISLRFDNGMSFIVTTTDDYPNGASFWYCEQTKESGAVEGSLPDKIYPELFKEARCKVTNTKASNDNDNKNNTNKNNKVDNNTNYNSNTTSKSETGVKTNQTNQTNNNNINTNAVNNDNDKDDQLGGDSQMKNQWTTSSSTGGGGCGAGSGSGMTPRGFSDDNLYGHEEDDPTSSYCAELQRDLDICKQVGFKTHLERVALGFRLSVEFFLSDLVSDSTALAWGFTRASPFNVRFQFERPEYIRSEKPPVVFVTQDGTTCRFGQQIRSFLELYLHDHWNRSGWVPPCLGRGDGGGGGKDGSSSSGQTTASPTKRANSTGAQSLEKLLNLLTPPQRLIYDQLCRMGFDEKIAAPAARQSSSVEEAIEKCSNGTVLQEGKTLQDSRSWFENLKEKAFGSSSSNSTSGSGGGDPDAAVGVATNNPISLTNITSNSASYDAVSAPSSSSCSDLNKFVPYLPEIDGWLVHIVKYVRKRTPLAHTYCVICDKPHLIGAGMLKPCVCERELCTYAFQQLKVGSESASSVATGGGVIDLLVSMFRIAVESERRDLIVDPYPQIADPSSGKLIFDPKNKDFDKLRKLTSHLPQTREILGVESLDQLTAKLVGKDPLLLPLLEWIISSNRSLIVKLRTDQLLKQMGTPHQFLLVSASPEKQAKFDALKNKYGSFFVFHGSRLENWHCIFRAGLRNYSNRTGFMLCGAALGPGIYTATSANMSLGYSQAQSIVGVKDAKNTNREGGGYFDGASSGQFACMALVEVAKDPSGYKDHGNVKTIQNEDAIITRFFFVFTSLDQVTKAGSVDTTQADFEKELRTLVAAT